MSDAPGATLRLQSPRLVNRIFYRLTTLFLRPIILSYFRLQARGLELVPAEGTALVLANHVALFDPIWLYALLKRPVYYAASEDLFRTPALARVIRWFGAFPKRKASSDVSTLRSIFAIAETKSLIGVFPEGVRTWDGANSAVFPGIAKLIRKLRVPVCVCRFSGAYLAYPRWARWWRRIPITGTFSRLYDPGTIPRDDAQILADITAAIRTPDYELELDPAKYWRRGLAVNLTRVLYRCPSCGTQEGLKIVRPYKTNQVECSSCFSKWVIDAACRLASVDENDKAEGAWEPLPGYYARIAAMPLTPIRTQVRLGMEEGEELFLISRPRFLMRQEQFPNLNVLAFGRAFLTSRRLVFRTRLGIPLAAPFAALGALSVDPGDRLHFTFEGKLYRIPFRNESALKWFDTIHRLQQAARQDAKG
jgi:1-acyl-sn-glycerol-3-phosphate acyltransferase